MDFATPQRLYVDAFTTSADCYDHAFWSPECNQVIIRGLWIFSVSIIKIVRGIREILTVSAWTNGRTNAVDGQPENIMP